MEKKKNYPVVRKLTWEGTFFKEIFGGL